MQEEAYCMLGVIGKYLHLCKEQWNVVLTMHENGFSEYARTVEGLERKFSSTNGKCMQTSGLFMNNDGPVLYSNVAVLHTIILKL